MSKSKIICFFLLLLRVFDGHATSLLDSLQVTPAEAQERFVANFYNRNLRYNKDSTYVIGQLQSLLRYTQKERLYAIECLSYSLLADHYARMRQFNAQSTALHKTAIELAEKYDLPLSKGIASYKTGRYFYNFKQFPIAFEYLLQADQQFEKVGYDKVPELIDYLFYMGNIYEVTGQIDKAISYFNRTAAAKEGTNRTWFVINAYDHLAHIYKLKNDFPRALWYYQKTLVTAQQYHYPDWEILSKGNIGVLYFQQGRTELAVPLLESAALACVQSNDRESASGYFYYLAKQALKKGNKQEAARWFVQMDTSYKHRSKYQAKRNYYEIRALLSEANGDLPMALLAWKKHQVAKDSLEGWSNQKRLKDIQIQMDTEAHLAHLQSLAVAHSNSILVRNILLLSSALFLGLLVLLYRRERSRRVLEKILFAEQKRRADEELDNARQALQSFTERMLEKNELIQQITNEIETLKEQKNETGEGAYQLYHKSILTANDWDDFKSLFEKVHPKFFYHQKQFYPQLTPGEVRLLTLIKLQLSSSEMAAMLGVSSESVKKSRQRLRKKLQPDDREKDFEALIGHW